VENASRAGNVGFAEPLGGPASGLGRQSEPQRTR